MNRAKAAVTFGLQEVIDLERSVQSAHAQEGPLLGQTRGHDDHTPNCQVGSALFCAHASLTSSELGEQFMTDETEIQKFIISSLDTDAPRPHRPTFTLVAGIGTGTWDKLSASEHLLSGTKCRGNSPPRGQWPGLLPALGFHQRVFKLITSLHGVFAIYRARTTSELETIHIIFCSPKSPIREIFCALRVDIEVSKSDSNTSHRITRMCCVLFDNYAVNHGEFREPHGRDSNAELGLGRLMNALKGESEIQRQPWQHPLTLLSAINKECAWSSACGQKEINRAILDVELFSGTASWARNPPEESSLTLRTFSKAMRTIGIHRTNLTFLKEMMDFQKHVWDGLYPGPSTSSVSIGLDDWSHPTHQMNTMSIGERISFQDEVNFERNKLVHDRNQLVGISQRFEFQTNLLDSILSHKESQQSAIVSIVVLLFAPTSVVLAVFSLPFINYADEQEWSVGVFIKVIVPLSIIPAFLGALYIFRDELFAGSGRWSNSK